MKSWAPLLVLALAGCEGGGGGAYARRVSSTADFIGGPKGMAAVGDWVIGNDRIKVIIQDQGWSRGSGIFGGGVIDVDLVRPGGTGTSAGGTGHDNFGEFFPALFLQAFDVEPQTLIDRQTRETYDAPAIEVIADGSDGGPAILRTRASGGDFITMVKDLLGAAVPQRGLRFETDYVIRPGTRHIEIIGRLVNLSGQVISLPDPGIIELLNQFGISGLQIPLGDVALFGAGNAVFAPGAVARWDRGHPLAGAAPKPSGFDLRFSVEANYKIPRALPALPGLVVDFLATASDEVSYGFAAADSERNYVWLNRAEYEKDAQLKVSKHSMLVPFLIDAFTGAYYEVPPEQLMPFGSDGDVFEYKRYLIVGNGDVASIRDELFRIRGVGTATLSGRVVDQRSGRAVTDAWVHILDADGHPYSQVGLNGDGRFVCRIEPGTYYTIVTAPGRHPFPAAGKVEATRFDTWTCKNDVDRLADCDAPLPRDRELFLQLPPPASIAVKVRDTTGRALPAKVTLVAQYEEADAGRNPRDFLFHLWLKEDWRATDLTWRDAPGMRERRFIEKVIVTGNGLAESLVRPSCNQGVCRPYDVYVSRGPEYDIAIRSGLLLEPGERRELEVTLERVVETKNWLSTDLHLHSVSSVDSFMFLDDRLRAAAAEGLEMPVATDHNALTDYAPTVAALGLGDWLQGVVGVELTTMEMGHFNAYPLRYDLDATSRFPFVAECNAGRGEKANRTTFDWVECTPQQLFDNVRELGRYGASNTIVQVNHPRDTILGYFGQFFLNPYTAVAEAPSGDNYPQAAFFIYPHDRVPGQFAPAAFSYDFDALEIFNGKRQDLLHAFRLSPEITPEALAPLVDICNGGHPDNAPGQVRLRQGGHPAYPGAVDDWFRLLNAGYAPVAVANSDSHELSAEVGNPRTYVFIEPFADGTPRDRAPSAVSDLDLVDALRSRRAVATNGPILDLEVKTANAEDPESSLTWPIGSVVFYGSSNVGRAVEVLITLKSAPWIAVDEILVWANGEVLDRLEVPQAERRDGTAVDDLNVFRRTYTFDHDVWILAEAKGQHSMFPIYTPKEEPPTNIGDALGGITAGLGLEGTFGAGDGVVAPDYVQKVFPYALTNPIWLDIDGSGRWGPPGNLPGPAPAPTPAPGQCPKSGAVRQPAAVAKRGLFDYQPGPRHYGRADIRQIFHGQAGR